MAILTGKGYATEAIRDLLTASGRARDYEVFVFQDAAHADQNIALTVREESKRMLGYSVDVIDIGLSYADAEACDNDGEPYPRRVHCQTWTRGRLTFFCERVATILKHRQTCQEPKRLWQLRGGR